MSAHGYLMHRPDVALVLVVLWIAIYCGYVCGRYDARHGRSKSSRVQAHDGRSESRYVVTGDEVAVISFAPCDMRDEPLHDHFLSVDDCSRCAASQEPAAVSGERADQ